MKITNIPHTKDDRNPFDNIYLHLKTIFSKELLLGASLNTQCSSEHKRFFYAYTYLEKACLINAPDFTYSLTYHFIDSSIAAPSNTVFEIDIIKGSKEYFPVFSEEITILSGMEVALTQDSKHRIKIGMRDKRLIIYTNKELSWDSLYKLKRLQYQIFKEYYTECDSALFDFTDALIEDNLPKAQKALDKIFDNPELKKIQYAFLNDYFTSNKERLTAILEERILKLRNKIDSYQNTLARTITLLNDDLLQYNALNETKDELNTEEIIDYILKHPYIKTITEYDNSEHNTLLLEYKAPLLYYDDAMLEILLTKTNGLKKDILTILKDRKYSIWTRCKILYKPVDFYIKSYTGVSLKDNAIAHPHIDRFGCLGNHIDAIKEWQDTGDYIGCIEQITAAVLNLNVTDSAVMNALESTLKIYSDYPCFQNNETKEFVTLNQIRKEMEDNEETQTK